MLMRTYRWSVAVLLVAIIAWMAGRAWGISFGLGQSKEELKLDYDVAVTDHGTGRVTVVLTITDEGRLKPLDSVQFGIPDKEKNESGGHWMDLAVSIEMVKAKDGKRIGRVHVLRELAERAQITFNTRTIDGKIDPTAGWYYVIPVAKYLKETTEPVVAPPAKPSTAAPAATERKND